MDKFIEAGVTIAGLIAAVAIVSALVSKNAQTAGVVQSVASGYANNIAVALSPVTGQSIQGGINTGYPSLGGMGLPTFGGFGTPSFQ
jgi:hypothetical protein